jgi:hypothetical protein
MGHLGSKRLGDRLFVFAQVNDSDGHPVAPAAAPYVMLGNASTRQPFRMVPLDRQNAPGLFGATIHLDERFSLGRYSVEYVMTVSGATFAEADSFSLVAGGDGGGAVIALCSVDRPQAKFLVKKLDSGRIQKGRNPTV